MRQLDQDAEASDWEEEPGRGVRQGFNAEGANRERKSNFGIVLAALGDNLS